MNREHKLKSSPLRLITSLSNQAVIWINPMCHQSQKYIILKHYDCPVLSKSFCKMCMELFYFLFAFLLRLEDKISTTLKSV